jgi:hypothetical protein
MIDLRALARLIPKRRSSEHAGERCEICAALLSEDHPHSVDLEARTLVCVCRACALLFSRTNASARYKTVPDRVLADPQLAFGSEDWAQLGIPVRLAFAFLNSRIERWIAVYPSAAGPTEAQIDPSAWSEIQERSALFAKLEPDVEAFLAYGKRSESTSRAFLAPIDRCYEIVARVRRSWKGYDGGDAVRAEIEAIFAQLEARARTVGDAP